MAVFGGSLSPLGWQVGFIEKPLAVVSKAAAEWWTTLGWQFEVEELRDPALADQLRRLLPLQQPFKRELLVATRSAWTAHFSNGFTGGDSAARVGYLAEALDCRAVVASHVPPEEYPYPATQFELFGPTGEKPLGYVRTISAGVYDEARWHFEVSGEQQPFEEANVYTARRVRDRFTRKMLLRYLLALGIDADDENFYGQALLFHNRERWPVAEMTLEEARKQYRRS